MGVPTALQVQLQAKSQNGTVRSWSLPAFVLPVRSFSVMRGTGDDLVILRSRVAEALGVQTGDTVDFLVAQIGETWPLKITVRDDITSDVLIHDLVTLKLLKSMDSTPQKGMEITLTSGAVLRCPDQEMWAGMKILEKKGSAKLFFDGASRNNPHGPCGYGFYIERTDDGSRDVLVKGSGYCGMDRSSNEMQYEGLIEGLIWATRLDLTHLIILVDSELVIKQMTGEYSIKNLRLKALNEKVRSFLSHYSCDGLEVTYLHIPRNENQIADSLANDAIETRMNVTTCNWPNINRLMKVPAPWERE
jgi:ribonuclease HI